MKTIYYTTRIVESNDSNRIKTMILYTVQLEIPLCEGNTPEEAVKKFMNNMKDPYEWEYKVFDEKGIGTIVCGWDLFETEEDEE